MKEFCSTRHREIEIIGPCMKAILPIALIKTDYEKNFIVIEAKQCMVFSVTNCVCSQAVDALVEGCQTKNLVLAEYSMFYLDNLVKNLDKEYFLTPSDSNSNLVK